MIQYKIKVENSVQCSCEININLRYNLLLCVKDHYYKLHSVSLENKW